MFVKSIMNYLSCPNIRVILNVFYDILQMTTSLQSVPLKFSCIQDLKLDSATNYPKMPNFDVTGCMTFILKLAVSSKHSFTSDDALI